MLTLVFTGLIEDIGEVVALSKGGGAAQLVVRTALPASDLTIGASLAVDGCCLTVVKRKGGEVTFDASAETLARTSLGRFKPGQRVNLERPLALGERLGGHLVLGHVDGMGTVERRTRAGTSERWRFTMPTELAPLVAEKGSITVDGISLTVNSVSARAFEVMLIPETLTRTALAKKRAGEAVNLETDVIAKHVARLLGTRTSVRLEEMLG